MKNIKNIKVYIPVKFETSIKGHWTDSQGTIFKDNIIIQLCDAVQFERIKAHLFNEGEIAVFYIQDNIAYVQSKNTLGRLTTKTVIENVTDENITELLKQYDSFTYFKVERKVDVWTK